MEEKTIVINDKEYKLSELSDKVKLCIAHINELDKEIGDLKYKLDEKSMARVGFLKAINDEITE